MKRGTLKSQRDISATEKKVEVIETVLRSATKEHFPTKAAKHLGNLKKTWEMGRILWFQVSPREGSKS